MRRLSRDAHAQVIHRGQARRVGAQKIATGIGLTGLAALLIGVGMPAILPPRPVPEIEIVVPAGNRDERRPVEPPEPPERPVSPSPAPAGDDDDDDPGEDPGGPGDDGSGDDDDDDDGGDDRAEGDDGPGDDGDDRDD